MRSNPQEIENITTPAKAFDLRGSQYDWAYKTTMIKREDYERVEKPNTRGKVLGGSSCANYFTWIPGSKPTFDDWEEYGGKEWTWDNIVAYLRKCATYHDDAKLYPTELSKVGTGGPLQISHADLIPEIAPFRDALTEGWTSKGHPVNEDIYSGKMFGLTHCLDTVYKGTRQGSFLYLKGKSNVTVLSEVQSKKLIIDPVTKVCSGVEVINPKTGGEIILTAKYEVIVSQGVFESPKLLMLSGVGPAAELRNSISPSSPTAPTSGKTFLITPLCLSSCASRTATVSTTTSSAPLKHRPAPLPLTDETRLALSAAVSSKWSDSPALTSALKSTKHTAKPKPPTAEPILSAQVDSLTSSLTSSPCSHLLSSGTTQHHLAVAA